VENLQISLPGLESPSNGQLAMSNPSGGYQLAEIFTKSLLIAEDLSTIPVDEGISNDTSSVELFNNFYSQQNRPV